MKYSLLLLLASTVAFGQVPRVGIIDFYGVEKTPEAKLREALGVKEGDRLPSSKSDTEEALERVDGVVRARLEAVCCDDGGDTILYVGIEERGAPHFDYLNPPSGGDVLPDEIHDEYVAFLAAVGLAVRSGETAEDLSEGHSLMASPLVRKHQERFLEFATDHLDELHKVLRDSSDDEQRAIAAYVLGYVPKKNGRVVQEAVDDLQRALRDPDDTVRNNATRSLGALAVLATKKPELGVKVSPTWPIEMLGSLIWQDRVAATGILLTLTEDRDQEVLQRVGERSEALAQMARWKYLPHALPAFILLGRVAGASEQDIQQAWKQADRETTLKQWLAAR